MKCMNCTTTLIGKFCHNCGHQNQDFSRREPMSFQEIADIFLSYPTPETIVEKCGNDRIAAIKMYREVSGLGLREAKDAIDEAYFAVYPRKPYQTW